jgi:hypothetical protein
LSPLREALGDAQSEESKKAVPLQNSKRTSSKNDKKKS